MNKPRLVTEQPLLLHATAADALRALAVDAIAKMLSSECLS